MNDKELRTVDKLFSPDSTRRRGSPLTLLMVTVLFVDKDILSAVAPKQDVVETAGDRASGFPRHGREHNPAV